MENSEKRATSNEGKSPNVALTTRPVLSQPQVGGLAPSVTPLMSFTLENFRAGLPTAPLPKGDKGYPGLEADMCSDVSFAGSDISDISDTAIELFGTLSNPRKVDLGVKKPIPRGKPLPSRKQPRGLDKLMKEGHEHKPEFSWQTVLNTERPSAKPERAPAFSSTDPLATARAASPRLDNTLAYRSPFPSTSTSTGVHRTSDVDDGRPTTSHTEVDVAQGQQQPHQTPAQSLGDNTTSPLSFDFDMPLVPLPPSIDLIPATPHQVATGKNASDAASSDIGALLGNTLPRPQGSDAGGTTAMGPGVMENNNATDSSSAAEPTVSSAACTPGVDVSGSAPPEFDFGAWADSALQETPQEENIANGVSTQCQSETSRFDQAVDRVLQETEERYRPADSTRLMHGDIFGNNAPSLNQPVFNSASMQTNATASLPNESEEDRREKSIYLTRLEQLRASGATLTRNDLGPHSPMSDIVMEVELVTYNQQYKQGIEEVKETLRVGVAAIGIGSECLGLPIDIEQFSTEFLNRVCSQPLLLEALWKRYFSQKAGSAHPEAAVVRAAAISLVGTIGLGMFAPLVMKIFGFGKMPSGPFTGLNKNGDRNSAQARPQQQQQQQQYQQQQYGGAPFSMMPGYYPQPQNPYMPGPNQFTGYPGGNVQNGYNPPYFQQQQQMHYTPHQPIGYGGFNQPPPQQYYGAQNTYPAYQQYPSQQFSNQPTHGTYPQQQYLPQGMPSYPQQQQQQQQPNYAAVPPGAVSNQPHTGPMPMHSVDMGPHTPASGATAGHHCASSVFAMPP